MITSFSASARNVWNRGAQWAKIRKNALFKDVTAFASKAKINIFLERRGPKTGCGVKKFFFKKR